jgi:hypothetical protein
MAKKSIVLKGRMSVITLASTQSLETSPPTLNGHHEAPHNTAERFGTIYLPFPDLRKAHQRILSSLQRYSGLASVQKPRKSDSFKLGMAHKGIGRLNIATLRSVTLIQALPMTTCLEWVPPPDDHLIIPFPNTRIFEDIPHPWQDSTVTGYHQNTASKLEAVVYHRTPDSRQ